MRVLVALKYTILKDGAIASEPIAHAFQSLDLLDKLLQAPRGATFILGLDGEAPLQSIDLFRDDMQGFIDVVEGKLELAKRPGRARSFEVLR